jgi:DNA gyrase subunit B/topoisomerase-4 subunit B
MNTEGMTLAKVLENKELADLVTALGCGMGKSFDLARLRYGKIIILADADSDGHHIATLLLTFIYRHLPQLITNGNVFLAQPPLYRIDIGKETFWALDDAHRDRLLKQHATAAARRRSRGSRARRDDAEGAVGDDAQPETRRLLRVEIADQIVTDRVINELMGKDASRASASSWIALKKRRNLTCKPARHSVPYSIGDFAIFDC